jgi:hypothetical protein
MKPKTQTYGGVTLDLSQVKCFKQGGLNGEGKDSMIVVFKTRYDYIKHPETGKFVKQEYNETVEVDYPNYATAKAHIKDWEGYWEEYLQGYEEKPSR